MNSPLTYVGGKSRLAKTIIERLPEHKTYCEVFSGAGWIFFKKEPSKYEVLNDLDSDLVTFYRVLQNHLEEFLKQFKWLLASREWFEDWKEQLDHRGLTDIQRAARYYYIQRLCFGGRVKGRTYGTSPERPPRINLLRIEEELSAVHLRLCNVTIENLDWLDFIQRYDKPDSFFYLDPPYYKAPAYKHNFKKLSEYEEMACTLSELSGDFILSLNDLPEIRKVFQNFTIEQATVKYSVSQKKVSEGKELIITKRKKE